MIRISNTKIQELVLILFFSFAILFFQLINSFMLDFNADVFGAFVVALLLHIVVIFINYNRMKRFDIFTLFIVINFFFAYGKHLLLFLGILDKEQAFSNSISNEGIVNASYWNIYCIVAIYIGYLFVPDSLSINKKAEKKYDVELQKSSLRITSIIFTVISIYPQFLSLIQTIELTKRYGYGYRIIEINQSTTIVSFVGGFFLPAVIAWIITRKDKEIIPIILLIVYFIFYLMTGSRLTLVCTAFGLLYYYFSIHIINFKKVLLIGIIGFFVLSVLSFLSSNRSALISGQQSILDFIFKNNIIFDSINEAGGTFKVSAVAIERCPKEVSHVYGWTYLYTFIYILPNAITNRFIPNIPNTDAAFSHFLVSYGGVGSSFSAEAYYNFGYFGVVILFAFGLLWGYVSRRNDESIKSRNVLSIFWYVQLIQAIVFMVRSDLMYRIRPLVWWTLPIIVVSILVYKTRLNNIRKSNI